MISRRSFFATILVAAVPSTRADAAPNTTSDIVLSFAGLEREHGGRLGVAVLDVATGRSIFQRPEERFPMCSTFKLLAAAYVLARVDRGAETLDRKIVYEADQIVPYSPVTEKHIGGEGLSVGELCEAAMTLSDNTAANLLLDSFGGPPALTDYMRSLGDHVTRLDRREPELNEAVPGDPRDTTTPVAMMVFMNRIISGNALSSASREQLITWLVANKTGDKRLRAGVPQGWRVGDKTGTGNNNTTNDIAVFWPPSRPPIIVVAYYTQSRAGSSEREGILREVGRSAIYM